MTLETLELRRLLAAQVWDIDSPQIPRNDQGQIQGNFVHEYDPATGREYVSPVSQTTGSDTEVLNASLRSAGFSGMEELVTQLGDPKEFFKRVEDALDDKVEDTGIQSIFGTDDRYQIFAGTTFPWRSVVKIGNNDGSYLGSGAIISPYHVLTAGHVVHSGAGGNWFSTLQVTPGQTSQWERPYGTAEWTWVRSYTNWTNSSDWNWDWALITLDRRIGNFTGYMGTEWNGSQNYYDGVTVNLAGYPGDKAIGTMWGSNGPINHTMSGGNKFRYNGTLDTMPGHSGSPLWRFDGTNRYIVGVHTNGDGGDGWNEGTRMTQQKFNDTWGWVSQDNTVRPPTDRPDLTDHDDWFNTSLSSVSPSTIQQGAGINASVTVRNNGTANANNTVVRFYASANTIISTSDIYLGERTVNVAALASTTVNFNGTIPASTPVGTYYIGWIIDATNVHTEYLENNNTGYHNSTISVVAAPVPDFFEPNDSWATARNLGTLRDVTYNGLNIHTANNDDYFRFTAGANGTLNVSLSFLHSQGDVDMSLLNSSGTVLTSSTSTSNSEFITWPVTRGVTYGLRIYGYLGATNPNYSMTLDGPDVPLDAYEPNDSFGTAADLGMFTSFSANNLTIHAPNNNDFYRFRSPGSGPGSVSLNFLHIDGDVDMALYTDTGTWIGSSTGVGNSELINFTASQGQSYVVHVYGYSGAMHWGYNMNIVAPPDTTPPMMLASQFHYNTAPHELRFTFTEDVSASLSPADLVLQNLTSSTTVPAAAIAVGWDAGTNSAIFTFPGFSMGVLPEGAYLATIPSGEVQDAAGNALATSYSHHFNFFYGDADGNGVIDFDDYAQIDAGFLGGLDGFVNGDFNYDGVIDFDDYAIIDFAYLNQP
jgi:V8-like Glu-specific endopeptidase